MTPHLLTFYILAAAAIVSAVAMVAAKNTVHAVLFMAGNFLVTAVLYLLLQAPFLALIQVIVYAGAIMVLFLFVVMIMGPSDLPTGETLSGQRALGLVVLWAFGVALVAAIATTSPSGAQSHLGLDLAAAAFAPAEPDSSEPTGGAAPSGGYPPPAGTPVPEADFGSPEAVGELLMTKHVVPLEVVSVLLLVAMLGAVVLGQERQP
jgi:NADH-quinone oxidoreductase subunit J